MLEFIKKRDLGNKLFAFSLAVILWLFVAGDDHGGTSFDVMQHTFYNIPLSWRNLGENLTITEMPEHVNITLQGRASDFAGLTPADLEAYVELDNRKEGRHLIRITAVAPPTVTIIRLEPTRAEVVLEELVTRQMKVEGKVTGSPADGLIVEEVTFTPEEAFVKGPSNVVSRVDRLLCILNMEGVTRGYKGKKDLIAVDAQGRQLDVEISPEVVEVKATVGYPEKEVDIELVVQGAPAEGYEVSEFILEPSTVKIKAPSYLLEEIESIPTQTLELDGMERTTRKIVYLDLPEGVVEVEQEPLRVTVVLEQVEQVEQ